MVHKLDEAMTLMKASEDIVAIYRKRMPRPTPPFLTTADEVTHALRWAAHELAALPIGKNPVDGASFVPVGKTT